MSPLLVASPTAMGVVAVVGCLTAVFAASMGLCQRDIKKVLAYSTVSQLGYMMLAVGVGAFGAAIFHLMTHAFFKALLFLGAGSVIHALGGEQDIMKMGALRSRLPKTHATFLVACIAIAGIPPFAGFFSKDEILWAALSGQGGAVWLWALGVLTAAMTAFYMTRLYLLVFGGPSRLSHAAEHHLHESPAVMTLPLILLAVGSALAGFLGVPHFLGGGAWPNFLERWLEPVLPHAAAAAEAAGEQVAGHAALGEMTAMLVALAAAAAGIAGAWALYGRGPLAESASPIARLLENAWYVDALYDRIILAPYRALCRFCAALDTRLVDGLVNATGFMTDMTGEIMRLTQTGYVRNYALGFFTGVVAILWYMLG
jgi:NADH-quinone oxidoreductase subunit L